MPFAEVSVMQQRRLLAYKVIELGVPLAIAAREGGVSRVTAYHWVKRAREQGIEGMRESPRIAKFHPRETKHEIVEALLQAKADSPAWGAKKLVKTLWPGNSPICVRTADRLLKKHGLVRPKGKLQDVQRFERERCNELWQIDFKGLGPKPWPYLPLSVLDDRSRFCLGVVPIDIPSSASVFSALWGLFGEFGLPECILSDNGDCFNSTRSDGCPTPFQAKLWLLGIRTTHGRPAHPQTQGKVERFHRTLQAELGRDLIQPTADDAKEVFARYVDRYNWIRPHEALDMRVPGALYCASPRKRPDRVPEHVPTGHGDWRKVGDRGLVSFRGKQYFVGKGLCHEHVEVADRAGHLEFYFAGRLFKTVEV